MNLPWKSGILKNWNIVGMNHYHQNGSRRIFVSMEREGRCIKAEGPDAAPIWYELARKAKMSE